MTYEEMFKKMMKWEGGAAYTDDPLDAGGPTKFGISHASLSTWRGYRVSKQEVKDLTEDEAAQIYRKMYFENPKIHLLHEAIQGPVFDFGVNAGPGRAIKALQTVSNRIGGGMELSVDGGIGPMTIKAVDADIAVVGAETFVNAYQDERQAFYNGIVARNPSQNRFILGWTRRVEDWRM